MPSLGIEEGARGLALVIAAGEIFVGDGSEVVEVVKVAIFEGIKSGVEVAGHGEVDEKEGTGGADTLRGLEVFAAEDMSRSGGRTDDGVKLMKGLGKILEGELLCFESLGECLGVFGGAVAEGEVVDATVFECLGGALADFT